MQRNITEYNALQQHESRDSIIGRSIVKDNKVSPLKVENQHQVEEDSNSKDQVEYSPKKQLNLSPIQLNKPVKQKRIKENVQDGTKQGIEGGGGIKPYKKNYKENYEYQDTYNSQQQQQPQQASYSEQPQNLCSKQGKSKVVFQTWEQKYLQHLKQSSIDQRSSLIENSHQKQQFKEVKLADQIELIQKDEDNSQEWNISGTSSSSSSSQFDNLSLLQQTQEGNINKSKGQVEKVQFFNQKQKQNLVMQKNENNSNQKINQLKFQQVQPSSYGKDDENEGSVSQDEAEQKIQLEYKSLKTSNICRQIPLNDQQISSNKQTNENNKKIGSLVNSFTEIINSQQNCNSKCKIQIIKQSETVSAKQDISKKESINLNIEQQQTLTNKSLMKPNILATSNTNEQQLEVKTIDLKNQQSDQVNLQKQESITQNQKCMQINFQIKKQEDINEIKQGKQQLTARCNTQKFQYNKQKSELIMKEDVSNEIIQDKKKEIQKIEQAESQSKLSETDLLKEEYFKLKRELESMKRDPQRKTTNPQEQKYQSSNKLDFNQKSVINERNTTTTKATLERVSIITKKQQEYTDNTINSSQLRKQINWKAYEDNEFDEENFSSYNKKNQEDKQKKEKQDLIQNGRCTNKSLMNTQKQKQNKTTICREKSPLSVRVASCNNRKQQQKGQNILHSVKSYLNPDKLNALSKRIDEELSKLKKYQQRKIKEFDNQEKIEQEDSSSEQIEEKVQKYKKGFTQRQKSLNPKEYKMKQQEHSDESSEVENNNNFNLEFKSNKSKSRMKRSQSKKRYNGKKSTKSLGRGIQEQQYYNDNQEDSEDERYCKKSSCSKKQHKRGRSRNSQYSEQNPSSSQSSINSSNLSLSSKTNSSINEDFSKFKRKQSNNILQNQRKMNNNDVKYKKSKQRKNKDKSYLNRTERSQKQLNSQVNNNQIFYQPPSSSVHPLQILLQQQQQQQIQNQQLLAQNALSQMIIQQQNTFNQVNQQMQQQQQQILAVPNHQAQEQAGIHKLNYLELQIDPTNIKNGNAIRRGVRDQGQLKREDSIKRLPQTLQDCHNELFKKAQEIHSTFQLNEENVSLRKEFKVNEKGNEQELSKFSISQKPQSKIQLNNNQGKSIKSETIEQQLNNQKQTTTRGSQKMQNNEQSQIRNQQQNVQEDMFSQKFEDRIQQRIEGIAKKNLRINELLKNQQHDDKSKAFFNQNKGCNQSKQVSQMTPQNKNSNNHQEQDYTMMNNSLGTDSFKVSQQTQLNNNSFVNNINKVITLDQEQSFNQSNKSFIQQNELQQEEDDEGGDSMEEKVQVNNIQKGQSKSTIQKIISEKDSKNQKKIIQNESIKRAFEVKEEQAQKSPQVLMIGFNENSSKDPFYKKPTLKQRIIEEIEQSLNQMRKQQVKPDPVNESNRSKSIKPKEKSVNKKLQENLIKQQKSPRMSYALKSPINQKGKEELNLSTTQGNSNEDKLFSPIKNKFLNKKENINKQEQASSQLEEQMQKQCEIEYKSSSKNDDQCKSIKENKKAVLLEFFDQEEDKKQKLQESNKQVSLAEIFKQKQLKLANIDQEEVEDKGQDQQQVQKKEKTKEELFELRKQMMKSKLKVKKDNFGGDQFQNGESSQTDKGQKGKDLPLQLMRRLATGQKPQIDKKEMKKLTSKVYNNLPEVQKKKEEEKKKEELIARKQAASDYAKQREEKRKKQLMFKKMKSSKDQVDQ